MTDSSSGSIGTLTGDTGSERIVVRDLLPDDIRPDEASPWDNWDDEWIPEALQPRHFRAAVIADDTIVGTMSWHAVYYGPTWGSRAWSIGIGLAPHARGRGIGTAAQRALSDALLHSAHRVEASTDIGNVAEQRSLEKAGFLREGVLRSAQFRRDGIHHDLVMYARTRDNAPSVPYRRGR